MLRKVVIPQYANLNFDMNFDSIGLPLQLVDFGYEFSQLIKAKKQGLISKQSETVVRSRCQAFLVRVCKELQSCISYNMAKLKKVSNFFSSVCLSQVCPPFASISSEFASPQNLKKIENQG